jgi:hypothetical protein
MIAKIRRGRSFGGLLEYLFNEREEQGPKAREWDERGELEAIPKDLHEARHAEYSPDERARVSPRLDAPTGADEKENARPGTNQKTPRGRVICGNMDGSNEHELAREFRYVKALRPGLEKMVVHASLRPAPGEQLKEEKWREAAEIFIKGMGYEEAMWTGVLHKYDPLTNVGEQDRDGHLHLVISAVTLLGKVVPDSHEYQRAEHVIRQIEEKFDLQRVPLSRETLRRAPTRGELERVKETGEPSVKMQLQELVDGALGDGATTTQLIGRLESVGVDVIPYLNEQGKMRGVTLRLDGELMKGSDLGRGYSFPGLQKRGLSYEPDRDREAIDAAKSREETRKQRAEIEAGDHDRDWRADGTAPQHPTRPAGPEDGRSDRRYGKVWQPGSTSDERDEGTHREIEHLDEQAAGRTQPGKVITGKRARGDGKDEHNNVRNQRTGERSKHHSLHLANINPLDPRIIEPGADHLPHQLENKERIVVIDGQRSGVSPGSTGATSAKDLLDLMDGMTSPVIQREREAKAKMHAEAQVREVAQAQQQKIQGELKELRERMERQSYKQPGIGKPVQALEKSRSPERERKSERNRGPQR